MQSIRLMDVELPPVPQAVRADYRNVLGQTATLSSLQQAVEQPANAAVEASTVDASGPGLTGENWFIGLQQGIGNTPDAAAAPQPAPVRKSASTTPSGNATAIPSLPSFWSGLSCCIAIMVFGFLPRIRRAVL